MTEATFDKASWVELLRQTGLDEAQMHRWHALFESKWPEAHQSFLEWLHISPEEIARIRESSRRDWA